MIIRKGNQSAPMGYHNGIPIWDGVKPEPADVYYMLSKQDGGIDILIPTAFNTNDIYSYAVILPATGSTIGDQFGVVEGTPGWSDNNDFRTFQAGSNVFFDCGSGRRMDSKSSMGYDETKKYEIFMQKLDTSCICKWTRVDDGVVMWNPTYTNSNAVKGYFGIKAGYSMRIYSLKVGNSNGLIIDTVATANGLLDKISGNIITTSHFTPVKE